MFQAVQNSNPNLPVIAQLYPSQRQQNRLIEKIHQGFIVVASANERDLYYRPTEQFTQPSRISLQVLFPN